MDNPERDWTSSISRINCIASMTVDLFGTTIDGKEEDIRYPYAKFG